MNGHERWINVSHTNKKMSIFNILRSPYYYWKPIGSNREFSLLNLNDDDGDDIGFGIGSSNQIYKKMWLASL